MNRVIITSNLPDRHTWIDPSNLSYKELLKCSIDNMINDYKYFNKILYSQNNKYYCNNELRDSIISLMSEFQRIIYYVHSISILSKMQTVNVFLENEIEHIKQVIKKYKKVKSRWMTTESSNKFMSYFEEKNKNGIKDINKLINNIDSFTQAKDTSYNLHSIIENLKQIISIFDIDLQPYFKKK